MDRLHNKAWMLGLLFLGFALSGVDARQPGDLPSFSEGAEHFVLEWPADLPHPARESHTPRPLAAALAARQIGLVEFRRSRVEGQPQLEMEIHFPFEGLRILAVESLSPTNPRLVWREISRGSGRTVFAEWAHQSAELRVLSWGSEGGLREQYKPRAGAVMPHYLFELARTGRATAGTFEVFDPHSGKLEPWTLTTRYERGLNASGELSRRAEFHRADGTLAGSYRFLKGRLQSFHWQAGGACGRRISAREYARLVADWGLTPPE
ncbi:MAG: hypothetical protein ABGY71_06245 [bacterium]|nr:hypothetical protein [Planctomycetota bacterium]HIL51270.1 hypothetical protein [Planctomycetota bacterium]